MSDIFEEVEESLRQDKAADLWKRFAPFVWAVGLAIIGAVAYREWALDQSRKEVEARVIEFEQARTDLVNGDYEAAQRGFEALASSGENIAPLAAQFLARSYYEGNGDAAAAAAALETSASIEGPLQRLALLKVAYLRADQSTLDELEAFLGDLPREPTALGALGLELIAAKAMKEGDLDRAREEFSYLRFAPNVPPGVVQRADIALGVIAEPEPDAQLDQDAAQISGAAPPDTAEAVDENETMPIQPGDQEDGP